MSLTYSEPPPLFPVSGEKSNERLIWFHFVSLRFPGISRGCLQLGIQLLRSTFVFFLFPTITSLFSQWRWQYVLWCMSVLWHPLQIFLSHWPIHNSAVIWFLQIHFRQVMTFFRRRLDFGFRWFGRSSRFRYRLHDCQRVRWWKRQSQ